ncbi:MAG: hypothetical protein A07HR60_02223 [uncultured archaeon A07HR60]|nr:MAG: hypothetical protein J07HR59_00321 [Halorubrum sp. J07HR59]ESS11078.1 MAG: hypothetical protein A07HR60_02223 [uncultured archaeon A07HR60]
MQPPMPMVATSVGYGDLTAVGVLCVGNGA